MHPRLRTRFVTDLRGHAVARISALLLLTLILLPFTAPFKTYDLAGTRSDTSSSDGLAKAKVSADDKLVSLSEDSLVPPTLHFVAYTPPTLVSQTDERPIRSVILRI
jgi:hypothetical protein